MDLISFSKEQSNINITPFKFALCSLINTFSQKENYINKGESAELIQSELFIYLETINDLIPLFQCENSKEILLKEISNKIDKYSLSNNISPYKLKENFIFHLNKNLCQIKTINDIYSFYKEITSPVSIKKDCLIFLKKGGHIDNFVRKNINSFHKLSFPDLLSLYEKIIKYNNNEIINVTLTKKESDTLFEKCFKKEDLNDKFNFKNFPQKVLFDSSNKNFLEKLSNLHKFYDYNLRYIYNENSLINESKIHYSYLYLINLYYDYGFYDKAIQILFECVKLSQSNCDHEALIKCFLWLSKIFIQIGNFDLASQCLSTCIIKSFQNNFQLLYYLSSLELSNLNFIFDSKIGLETDKKNVSLEEKILSHSNNYLHLYKNISDYYTVKDNDINTDLNTLMIYTNSHLIFNLIREGEFSLAIDYMKINLKIIFNKNNADNYTEIDIEIINTVLCFMMNLIDFDYFFCVDIIYDIVKKNKDNNINEFSLKVIVNKYCSQYVDYNYNLNNDESDLNISIYYKYVNEFYYFIHFYYLCYNDGNYFKLESELLSYINKCKSSHMISYKVKALILLSRIYYNENKITESIIILNKIINNENSSIYDTVIAKINLCYCYYYGETNLNKAKDILLEIKMKVENVCNESDKFDYYYLSYLLLGKKEEIKPCLKYAIILNNFDKIKIILGLIKEFTKDNTLEEKIKVLLDNNNKLFSLLNNFKLSYKEAIEVIYLINNNNKEFIKQNIN